MDSLCGDTNSRIAFGGNDIDVGCDGAGGGDASPSNGYPSSQTINVGPWCLTRGDSFDITIDDFYAPNQPNVTVVQISGSLQEGIRSSISNRFNHLTVFVLKPEICPKMILV